MTAKEIVRELLDTLPDSATLEDIQYSIYVREKIEHALDAARRGEIATDAEVESVRSKWTRG